MDITIYTDTEPEEEIRRAVTLTNEQWLVITQCVESFAETYRKRHSQTIATYVTRGQLDEAQEEARVMNRLLQQLDKLQALIV
jgi:uridine kinase